MLLENWSNGAWENTMQQLPSYDEKGRLIKNEIAYWNTELNLWEAKTKTIFNRDIDGNLLSRETLKWMPDQGIWQASIRANYTNNEFKKPSTVLNEVFDGNVWSNQSIEDLKYNGNGKMTEKLTERWNKQLLSWVPDRKFIYSIESDRTAGYIIYFWDNNLAQWQPHKKAKNVYVDDAIDCILFDTWIDDAWEAQSIRKNTYDKEGALSELQVDDFETSTETWSKSSHVDFELTDFGKIAQSIHKKWNTESGNWENLQRSSYTYSKTGEMIEDWMDNNKQVELFPNPATETLTIRSLPKGKITVHDALGKVVFESDNTEPELKLDVTKWEIGVYTVQVNGNETEKFVKQ